MIVKNKIWEEFKQAHANVLCIRWYNDRQRRLRRWYQLFIAIVASVSTFGFLLNDKFPFFGSLIIAMVSVAKSIFPRFVQPEQELCDLDRITDFYNLHMIRLECLSYRLGRTKITEDEAVEELCKLLVIEGKNRSAMNRLVRYISPKRKDKIVEESEEYIKQVYYNCYESQFEKEDNG